MLFSKKYFLTPFLLVLLLFLVGCSAEELKDRTADKLKWINNKLDQNTKDKKEEDPEKGREELSASDLSKEEKERIDQWLEDNNLNRYGDSARAIYPGGTPLYNEKTGESINRFDYILDRYPDILERINNNGDQSP